MKKILTLFSAILLVVALAVPAFASNMFYGEDILADIDSVWTNKVELPYATIFDVEPFGYRLLISSSPITTSGSKIYVTYGSYREVYTYKDDTWVKDSSQSNSSGNGGWSWVEERFVWASHDIKNGDTVIFSASSSPTPALCDGSACPATDADHNNVCDDCGNVLAYNLRSTLLSYAQNLATRFNGYSYYAITEHEDGSDKLWLMVSKTPMYANMSDPYTALGTDMLRTAVVTMSDGSFGYQSQDSVSSWTGTLIDANHTLENFMIPPLAEVIQGVTGEAMAETLPELEQTILTILLCGVGCLALLIGLNVFGKVLGIFRT